MWNGLTLKGLSMKIPNWKTTGTASGDVCTPCRTVPINMPDRKHIHQPSNEWGRYGTYKQWNVTQL